eukprot:CAMPEP_0182471048 /NCGR_PEP_ID=MMETSP1319-20130603/19684_1 /TAXON_ID=172717 /ORGANISM="Bolidomonas pacifica, Strain RCC208" /LENGTH=262 /DNA_ID=CAMNT_0024671561 /DNA_START=3 /DNA_END=788 /DNA_ORIENTATION=-
MEAADALSSALSKVATNLSTIQHAFSQDFSRMAKLPSGSAVPNPEDLLERLSALQSRIESLTETATTLVSSRPVLVQETSSALLSNYMALAQLAKRTNYSLPDASQNPFSEQAQGTAFADRNEMATSIANQLALAEGSTPSPIVAEVLTAVSKADAPKAASKADSSPSQILPATVDDDEFNSISASIRGRSKLESLNALLLHLTSLHNHTIAYKKTYNMGKSHASTFYTLKELDKQGFKVHGATGTSMLRSLEALGRIEVDK